MIEAEPEAVRILRNIIEGDDATMQRGLQEGRELLERLRIGQARQIPEDALALIIRTVAAHYSFSVAQLRERTRTASRATARQVAYYFCRLLLQDHSFESIGAQFNRDHGTVIHGIEVVKNRMATEHAFKLQMDALLVKLQTALQRRTAA